MSILKSLGHKIFIKFAKIVMAILLLAFKLMVIYDDLLFKAYKSKILGIYIKTSSFWVAYIFTVISARFINKSIIQPHILSEILYVVVAFLVSLLIFYMLSIQNVTKFVVEISEESKAIFLFYYSAYNLLLKVKKEIGETEDLMLRVRLLLLERRLLHLGTCKAYGEITQTFYWHDIRKIIKGAQYSIILGLFVSFSAIILLAFSTPQSSLYSVLVILLIFLIIFSLFDLLRFIFIFNKQLYFSDTHWKKIFRIFDELKELSSINIHIDKAFSNILKKYKEARNNDPLWSLNEMLRNKANL